MLQVKLPYYPKLQAKMTMSPTGIPEIDYHDIYNHPVKGKTIVRVDLLEQLRGKLDDNIFYSRRLLYALISGQTQPYNWEKILFSYYHKFKKVRTLINDEYMFGDGDIPLCERVLANLDELYKNEMQTVIDLFERLRGKFLIQTHGYIYYAFPENVNLDLTELKGVTFIC